jgi:hypothetical protein
MLFIAFDEWGYYVQCRLDVIRIVNDRQKTLSSLSRIGIRHKRARLLSNAWWHLCVYAALAQVRRNITGKLIKRQTTRHRTASAFVLWSERGQLQSSPANKSLQDLRSVLWAWAWFTKAASFAKSKYLMTVKDAFLIWISYVWKEKRSSIADFQVTQSKTETQTETFAEARVLWQAVLLERDRGKLQTHVVDAHLNLAEMSNQLGMSVRQYQNAPCQVGRLQENITISDDSSSKVYETHHVNILGPVMWAWAWFTKAAIFAKKMYLITVKNAFVTWIYYVWNQKRFKHTSSKVYQSHHTNIADKWLHLISSSSGQELSREVFSDRVGTPTQHLAGGEGEVGGGERPRSGGTKPLLPDVPCYLLPLPLLSLSGGGGSEIEALHPIQMAPEAPLQRRLDAPTHTHTRTNSAVSSAPVPKRIADVLCHALGGGGSSNHMLEKSQALQQQTQPFRPPDGVCMHDVLERDVDSLVDGLFLPI